MLLFLMINFIFPLCLINILYFSYSFQITHYYFFLTVGDIDESRDGFLQKFDFMGEESCHPKVRTRVLTLYRIVL